MCGVQVDMGQRRQLYCTLDTVRECDDDGLPFVLLRINIAIGRHMCRYAPTSFLGIASF